MSTASKQPGGWVNVHAAESTRTVSSLSATPAGGRALRVFLANPVAISGLAIIGLIALAALLAPLLFPRDPFAIVGSPQIWPGQDPAFLLGTDALGRDV